MVKNVLFAFLLIASVGCAQVVGPKISALHEKYDFGDIAEGSIVTHEFVISNVGGDVLKIGNVRASCGCTAAKPEKTELKPGEDTNIKVTFNSRGRSGKQVKHVYVASNDKEKPTLNLTFTVNVVLGGEKDLAAKPNLFFAKTDYDFGKVTEGKVVDHTFTFKNTGKATLEIKNIKTSCGCTAALVSNKKLKAGEEGTIRVELDTSNRHGKLTRTVIINSNDPDEPQKVLTIYAEITDGKS